MILDDIKIPINSEGELYALLAIVMVAIIFLFIGGLTLIKNLIKKLF